MLDAPSRYGLLWLARWDWQVLELGTVIIVRGDELAKAYYLNDVFHE